MSDLKEMIDAVARKQNFLTVTWNRVTDEAPTKVTANGIVAKHKTHGTYIWIAKNGEEYVTLRGRIIASDDRTQERVDGDSRHNVSDAGADGKWHYWSVRLSSIVELLADGRVILP